MAEEVRSLFIPKENPIMSNPAQIPSAMEVNTTNDLIFERQILRQAILNIMSAYSLLGSRS